MVRLKLVVFLFLISTVVFGQEEFSVPEKMQFADMELELSKGLRKKIEEQATVLTKNKKYLQVQMDRADFYFPIIDRVFDEEGFFHDFKYLCLQESSLISDAVSTSNAVGFWQFKKETALEVGLTVDHHVDERKHISASTRGAIKYLKRNNFYFNNWIYAVMAYNTGVGGAKNLVDEKYFGEKKMKLDENAHWYVIKFLAHKVAFENLLGKNHTPPLLSIEYLPENEKTLNDIADKTSVDLTLLKDYNKWLISHKFPTDKPITVIIPSKPEENNKIVAVLGKNVIKNGSTQKYYVLNTTTPTPTKPSEKQPVKEKQLVKPPKNPKNAEAYQTYQQHSFYKWNGVKSVLAKKDDTPAILANVSGIPVKKFLKYNDLKSFENIQAGKNYYVKPKNKSAKISYHTVKDGETVWSISQEYGIKLKHLLKKNRMKKGDYLEPGRKIWLKNTRPEEIPVVIEKPKKQVIKTEESKPIEQKPIETKPIEVITKPKVEKIIDTLMFKTHTVTTGQTLFSIGKMYNASLDSMTTWNGKEQISIGQKLIVGRKIKNTNNKTNYIVHTVAVGETLYKIAKKYYVTLEDIKKWNDKKVETVSLGEQLKIYTK